ncbi:MAG: Gfo/Idh/MocA family oxidoreductase [Bacteroidales bacterium]|nr:Gfo/Idh/MocA family oxidoreductase [Candidatus Physcousia equi]
MKLRIAIVGLGQRGLATLRRLRDIPDVEVVAVCDKKEPTECELSPPVSVFSDWNDVVRRADIHLLYICTPWDSHVEIAVEAMKQGKNVAIEVPAAMTVHACELLVRVARWTERHCVMLENCCYDTWHLGIKEMVRQGLLGQVTHLEGAYIHTLGTDWMHELRANHRGNPYPTHGLGPMLQLLDDDDRLEYLVSMSANNQKDKLCLSDTLLHSRKGVSLLLQYDTSTPRPYNRLQTVCGTLGYAQKYPLPTIQIGDMLHTGNEAVQYVEGYIAPEMKQILKEGRERGVSNVMNYAMDRRLIDLLLLELESGKRQRLDMEVEEAALWSCVTELTEKSAQQGSERFNIPEF